MHYSIADLEKYTGIKAHTIRMWEQRYALLSPHRTETNIRYYDDEHLRKMLNVASLVRNGMRISKISKMSEDEMARQLEEQLRDSSNGNSYAKEINSLMMSALMYDEDLFHRTFADCLIKYGLEATYQNVLNPVMFRTGLMWSNGQMDVCQEHFVSNLIRQKLFTAADKLADPKPDAKKWVLFLPGQEEHDIGLLYANFLIRQYGHKVIYLGQRVPFDVLVQNMERIAPDVILTFLKHTADIQWTQDFVNEVSESFGDFNPIISGPGMILDNVECPNDVVLMTHPDQLMAYLT